MKLVDALALRSRLIIRLGKQVLLCPETLSKSDIEVSDNFRCNVYEHGKLITTREGHNVNTLAGKEFVLSSLCYGVSPGSVATPYDAYARRDKICYIGAGTGATPEVVGVSRLVSPIDYVDGVFLAELEQPPARTSSSSVVSVTFRRVYSKTDLSFGAHPLARISEFGLFTDGVSVVPEGQLPWAPGTRSILLANSGGQEPMFYKTVEPFPKNTDIVVEVLWEVRI